GTRKLVRDRGIDRVLREVDEFLSVLRSEESRQLALGQPILEQDLTDAPPAVGCLRECPVDVFQGHEARAIDERAERIAPHLSGAEGWCRRRSRRRLARLE